MKNKSKKLSSLEVNTKNNSTLSTLGDKINYLNTKRLNTISFNDSNSNRSSIHNEKKIKIHIVPPNL